ncbi:Suppressor of disruption of TFIIS [Rhodotorula toruloides]|uniref:Haloacid dehalogenase-like hydrolase-domain containing protein n=1 Tax=Rhodotorula toruloides TaxID=5286 RepID=A0A2T0A1K4_RHOTO|nr:Suppressor of disruption of TFIIS [Rhodotorula toruloides]PRQ71880.1 Haloacid dehalogenase-like hydrolase-domain containing protein [Rhodotorula toruloides]
MTVPRTHKRSTLVTNNDGTPRGTPPPLDDKLIVLFDIDNTLYSKEAGIAELMKDKIRAYFRKLGLTEEEAAHLHHEYYKTYGLAIRGLVRHHKVDPLDYDKHCDQALPLETVLKVDPRLQQLLRDIDREKCHVWALTNAYVNHAVRVLKLLGISEFFEGIVSCDYGAGDFSCKPEAEFFQESVEAVSSPPPPLSRLYFVDDSALNIRGANALGWGHCVLFDEAGAEENRLGGLDKMPLDEDKEGPAKEAARVSVISDLEELRHVWREVFKAPPTNGSS